MKLTFKAGRRFGVRRPGAALVSITHQRYQSGARPPHSKTALHFLEPEVPTDNPDQDPAPLPLPPDSNPQPVAPVREPDQPPPIEDPSTPEPTRLG